jgi:DNA (cytosine-5)-methyltransferase 1
VNTQSGVSHANNLWLSNLQHRQYTLRAKDGVKMLKVLDLFCGAGGASRGYADAGFDVTGIDVKHGKRYPFTYIRQSIEDVNVEFVREFDFIHASPPCQTFSITKNLRIAQGKQTDKQDWLPFTRDLLVASGKPYVIENVPGAPLIDPVLLCGSAFGLKVRRHRLFESNLPLKGTICSHKEQGRPVGIYGSMKDEIPGGGRTAHSMDEAKSAMGIDWMIWGELVEAIPPAYTKHIGLQVRAIL